MKKTATKSKKSKAPVQNNQFIMQQQQPPMMQQQQPPMMQQQQPPMMQMPQVNYGNSYTPMNAPQRRQNNVRGGVYGMNKPENSDAKIYNDDEPLI